MNSSFEVLVDEYKPMILSIMKKLHIYRDHEAFYQVGLIALWEAHSRFDEEKGSFSTYAYAVIRGKFLDYMKKENAFYDHHQGLPEEASLSLVDTNTPQAFEEEGLEVYIEGLSVNQRKWVQKRIIEDKRIVDIAKEEGVSAEAVKSWGKAAVKKMKRIMEAYN
ncbi:sigma-70 family RNA polymerase sigma factor [Litchfieldia alkalitelluris]|uniref:sigma-70 family RNA polymerase sigma factor n=1 Tax=Litchfieldia alkalitelluris TaxID=304268 RepID=UPI000997354A|nr:sigma-70 family RNA polymerase sigma factor [Litchfieldia alkalitelluris]